MTTQTRNFFPTHRTHFALQSAPEKNRPAHKGYNKLSAKEDSRTSAEVHSNQDILDNESGIAANNGNAQTNGNPGLMDSDNESTFTDLDYEDGGFSDDSDYGEYLCIYQGRNISELLVYEVLQVLLQSY
ncbi:hypothetical protein HUJ05_011814 [Dendroctonus ponderosae]|nr:hypothetical protein HUJ05_011814 [Dendroctonus ponderosae]